MRFSLLASLILFLAFGALAGTPKTGSKAADVRPFYKITAITSPPGVDSQVGGLAGLPDGRLAAAFHHGEVAIYDPKKEEWKIFAQGLHEPLGLLPEKDGSLLVMQRPELTRLRDTDGDGVADSYETVWDDFGLTGNYHEFAFGPVRGPNGKLYCALNLASNGATIREEIRGSWMPIGLPREQFYGDWKKVSKSAGRMYSRVPWRGWVMEIDEATGQGTPFACGFRSPDGIAFDEHGDLLVSDNQGDWLGACELLVVEKNGFYGHPASLVWRKDWDGAEPLKLSIAKLDALRTPAAICFPYGSYANSPTQIVTIPKTPAWGPFGGQVLIGEMNAPKILRLLLEKVDGAWQGACISFIESELLKKGQHRMVFIGDTLWLGRTHLSWAGSQGISKVEPTGEVPFEPLLMQIKPHGFQFKFTEPLDSAASNPALWTGKSYNYAYHSDYGSPEMNLNPFTAAKVTLSDGGKIATVELADVKPDLIYDFDLSKLKSAAGKNVQNPRIAYTVRRIPKS